MSFGEIGEPQVGKQPDGQIWLALVEPEGDLGEHAVGEELIVHILKDHGRHLEPVLAGERLVTPPQGAAAVLVQSTDQARERGLARAVQSGDGDHLARAGGEVDAGEHVVAAIGRGQGFGFQIVSGRRSCVVLVGLATTAEKRSFHREQRAIPVFRRPGHLIEVGASQPHSGPLAGIESPELIAGEDLADPAIAQPDHRVNAVAEPIQPVFGDQGGRPFGLRQPHILGKVICRSSVQIAGRLVKHIVAGHRRIGGREGHPLALASRQGEDAAVGQGRQLERGHHFAGA